MILAEALKEIDEVAFDCFTRERVGDEGSLPGALWHIYHAKDVDHIRSFLNKV